MDLGICARLNKDQDSLRSSSLESKQNVSMPKGWGRKHCAAAVEPDRALTNLTLLNSGYPVPGRHMLGGCTVSENVQRLRETN